MIPRPNTLERELQSLRDQVRRLSRPRRAAVPVVTADPAVTQTGDLWFRGDTAQLCVVDGSGVTKRVSLT